MRTRLRNTLAWLVMLSALARAVAQPASVEPEAGHRDTVQAAGIRPGPPDTRTVAERALAATVGIACAVDGGFFQGSGTVVSSAGHVLTATSVVPRDAADIRVVLPGHAAAAARIVAVDEPLGVTLLAVDADGLQPLPLAADLPAVGDAAYTAGDVERTLVTDGRAAFSRGVVSGLYEVAPQGDSTYGGLVIETTAAVNQGSDGGPLLDAAGRLCGVILLGVAPRRWQGVAVPTEVLLRRFGPLAGGTLPIATAPRLPRDPTAALAHTAAKVSRSLVGIEVTRRDPPEILPRESWHDFRAAYPGDGTAAGWDALDAAGRSRAFGLFVRRSFSREVNQLLRRPPGQVTGLVISSDGLVLTSLFNVGGDVTFVAREPAGDAAAPADADRRPVEYEARPNPVTRIEVVLPDGRRHPATVKARHEPLGVALLAVEASGLDAVDLDAMATSPQLGDAVAVVGWLDGGTPGFTLNTGIVAAAARSRGYQFQTDALLNYGNSGGPVIDAAGNVYGLAAAPLEPDTVRGRIFTTGELRRWNRAPNSGVGLVARADRLREAIAGLADGRSVERFPGPFLGVVADTSRALAGDVVVAGVAPGSPAASAGLAKGDRILEFNGAELTDWRDLTDRIAAATAGETVTLTVERRGRGPRLVIGGRDIETAADLDRLRRSLQPGDTFTGELTTDDVRRIDVVLEESR